MSWSGVQWDITPYTLELDENDHLYYVERLIVEANTNSNTLTPVLVREDANITLSAISTASRLMSEITINRLGPVLALQLNNSSWGSQNIQIHEVALFLRKLELVMNMAPTRNRSMIPGRTTTPTSAILFDINPFLLPENPHHINPVMRRLFIDAVTGAQTVTPHLILDDGTDVTLAGITTATRVVTEYSVMRSDRIKRVQLSGDFTKSSNIIFSVESDWYYPSSRSYQR